jgi:hypothetical protein
MSTMNSRRVIPLSTIAVLVGLLAGAGTAGASEARGSVTRAEFRQADVGMTRGQVQRIFGAGGGCAYLSYAVEGVRYVNRQYRQDNGLFTAIQYDTSVDGRLRVRDIRFAKQWNLEKLCD